MKRLEGKIAIVTGGAQGIGAAIARLFTKEGARVLIGDVDDAAGEALAGELGPSALFHRLDVRSDESWAAAVEAATAALGPVDILVNNAGIIQAGAIEQLDLKDTERLFSINVLGMMLGAKHVVPGMVVAGHGAIINMSSVDGLRGCNGLAAYSATKWAIRGLTKSLAMELGPRGIRVCSVHPGGINTRMGNPAGNEGEELDKSFRRVPIQRIGEADEIARATLFVASDDAGYITGTEIVVDGGWSAGYYQPVLPGAPAALVD